MVFVNYFGVSQTGRSHYKIVINFRKLFLIYVWLEYIIKESTIKLCCYVNIRIAPA